MPPVAYLDAQSSRSLLYLPDRDFLGQSGVSWKLYLNVIETVRNMYIEAPARPICGKTAEHLNRHEASMIASVLPNPIR